MGEEEIRERGRKMIEEAEKDREVLVSQVQEFRRKYPHAGLIFGCTIVEGMGAKYVKSGPPGSRIRMATIQRRLAEDEDLALLGGEKSNLVPVGVDPESARQEIDKAKARLS